MAMRIGHKDTKKKRTAQRFASFFKEFGKADLPHHILPVADEDALLRRIGREFLAVERANGIFDMASDENVAAVSSGEACSGTGDRNRIQRTSSVMALHEGGISK